jgi:hypothetical protein
MVHFRALGEQPAPAHSRAVRASVTSNEREFLHSEFHHAEASGCIVHRRPSAGVKPNQLAGFDVKRTLRMAHHLQRRVRVWPKGVTEPLLLAVPLIRGRVFVLLAQARDRALHYGLRHQRLTVQVGGLLDREQHAGAQGVAPERPSRLGESGDAATQDDAGPVGPRAANVNVVSWPGRLAGSKDQPSSSSRPAAIMARTSWTGKSAGFH